VSAREVPAAGANKGKAIESGALDHADDPSALAGIDARLPAPLHTLQLLERAARTGFDWADAHDVLAKLVEEVDEVRVEFARGSGTGRLEDEIGDVLFVLVNLTRHAGVDFSAALRHANAKFEHRFRQMEQLARADGGDFAQLDLAAQERLWQRVKQAERATSR
jgi:ATP diphosphatase